jgi:hypothetical protein
MVSFLPARPCSSRRPRLRRTAWAWRAGLDQRSSSSSYSCSRAHPYGTLPANQHLVASATPYAPGRCGSVLIIRSTPLSVSKDALDCKAWASTSRPGISASSVRTSHSASPPAITPMAAELDAEALAEPATHGPKRAGRGGIPSVRIRRVVTARCAVSTRDWRRSS